MILHTIIPLEQVFSQPMNVTYEYRPMHNGYLQGIHSDGVFTVSRVISTNPRDYLDPRFAPGSTLRGL